MNDSDQVYQNWVDKQQAMGRTVPASTSPTFAKPKRKKPGHSDMPVDERRDLLAKSFGKRSYLEAGLVVQHKIDKIINNTSRRIYD